MAGQDVKGERINFTYSIKITDLKKLTAFVDDYIYLNERNMIYQLNAGVPLMSDTITFYEKNKEEIWNI